MISKTLISITRSTRATIYILAMPVSYICAQYGQNGILLAAIIGAAFIYSNKSPIISGALLGMLCIKPHLFIFMSLLVLKENGWKIAAGAAISSITLVSLSIIQFGTEIWSEFIDSSKAARIYLEQGILPWNQMTSFFAVLRQLGISTENSYYGHFIFLMIFSWISIKIMINSKSKNDSNLVWGGLILTSLIASPFQYQYDLAITYIPIAILIKSMKLHGCHTYMPIAIIAIAAAPGVFYSILPSLSFITAPILLILTLQQSKYIKA